MRRHPRLRLPMHRLSFPLFRRAQSPRRLKIHQNTFLEIQNNHWTTTYTIDKKFQASKSFPD